MGCDLCEYCVARGNHGIISHGDDPIEHWHTFVVYVVPHGFSDEKESGAGVVDNVVDRIGFKLVKDGYGHSPVS